MRIPLVQRALLLAALCQPFAMCASTHFEFDAAGIVSRSNIVLQRPNTKREEAMPLGNGRLGLAVWSDGGLRLQLNRADTLPGRLSPGQVVLPGLQRLTGAGDYTGSLDLYRGEFKEHGGGLTATVYVQPNADTAIIDVTGARPDTPQTAILSLWQPRKPQAIVHAGTALLAETWQDNTEAGASGATFGSLAAMSVDGRNIHAEVQDSVTVKLSFLPKSDGSFRLFVAAPAWSGGDPTKFKDKPASRADVAEHQRWWRDFWQRGGLLKMQSQDGSAQYLENLRCIDLYTAAAESLGHFPGSQAGIGDLFSSMGDEHKWSPSAYWHWNLRMQTAANLGAGLYELNDSYFTLYRENLQRIEAWTKAHMANRSGACVPETMRFNGQGYENETWLPDPGLNCSAESKPYYNARTLSTGAEVSLWIWRQYLATQDLAFLKANYPVMASSARFLLAYAKPGSDGLLHSYPSNAHENVWDVHDPTTDLSAMKAFFPAVISAARLLKTDASLVSSLESALGRVPELPKSGASNADVIAQSYDLDAPVHNSENVGLEPVWPYSLIGDAGPLHDTAVRTYQSRTNKFNNDWSWDPLQAARLGLPDEVESALLNLTEKYQAYPNGFAQFAGPEFYVEQVGVLAAALQEALVQDYDGLLRIAPAWPKNWDVDGAVWIRGKSKVDVSVRNGIASAIVLEAGTRGQINLRNPWKGEVVTVLSRQTGAPIASGRGATLEFAVDAGHEYLIQRATTAAVKITGVPAGEPKTLGTRHIGLLRK